VLIMIFVRIIERNKIERKRKIVLLIKALYKARTVSNCNSVTKIKLVRTSTATISAKTGVFSSLQRHLQIIFRHVLASR
jgi:hypothetical protein